MKKSQIYLYLTSLALSALKFGISGNRQRFLQSTSLLGFLHKGVKKKSASIWSGANCNLSQNALIIQKRFATEQRTTERKPGL